MKAVLWTTIALVAGCAPVAAQTPTEPPAPAPAAQQAAPVEKISPAPASKATDAITTNPESTGSGAQAPSSAHDPNVEDKVDHRTGSPDRRDEQKK